MFSRIPANRRAPLLFVLVFLLLLAGYFIAFTREYLEVDQGFSKAARSNPYLAAQLYLTDKTHVTWRSHQALQTLQSGRFSWQGQSVGPGDTLILANAYGSFTQEETDNIWSWVEQGGQLIYHVGNPFIDIDRIPTDSMLEDLALELSDKPDTVDANALGAASETVQAASEAAQAPNKPANYVQKLASKPIANCYFSRETLLIPLPDKEPALVDLGPGRGIVLGDERPTAVWLPANMSAVPAAAFKLGQGRITFLNNLSAWENTRIGCGDHGYFLKNTIGSGQTIAWFLNLNAPNLWHRLWALAPEAVLASVFALLAWLWHANVRFGEALIVTPTQRRAFLDHFKAWANYLWRAPLISEQIRAQRQDCLQRATRRVPGFLRFTADEQLVKLEHLTGLSAPQIHQALFRPIEQYQAQCITDIIFALQQLRSHL
ncbi:MAG TPA: DUF4350 domain-containing protein [Cellvibrionaceae bacterium]